MVFHMLARAVRCPVQCTGSASALQDRVHLYVYVYIYVTMRRENGATLGGFFASRRLVSVHVLMKIDYCSFSASALGYHLCRLLLVVVAVFHYFIGQSQPSDRKQQLVVTINYHCEDRKRGRMNTKKKKDQAMSCLPARPSA